MTAPQNRYASVALKAAAAFWLIATVVIMVHVWRYPESNTVYKVFRAGGARWLAGENLYPKIDEYIYSPFAAAIFAPLALLPDRVSGIIWRLISLAIYAGAFSAWLRNIRTAPMMRIALAWMLLLPLSLGDIFNGQANPLVIGLVMLAILACRQQRWLVGALCIGVATYFKVYPLALGLLLCVLHPRQFPPRLALAIAGIFLLSLVLQHPPYVLAQYSNWIHSLGQDPRRTLNYYGTYRDVWLLLRVLRVPITMSGWTVLQAAAGCCVAIYLFLAKRRGVAADKLEFLLLTLVTCWMLLFGPATESSTFVILAPPLLVALVRWSGEHGASRYLASAAACYLFLIASQMLTSWAHQHQNAFTHLIQPVGTMIFAVALLAYGWKSNPEAELAGGAAVH